MLIKEKTSEMGKSTPLSGFEKWSDLVKWFIGSVVLVIVTLIVDKGFRERSAGIQEMQAFDRYVEIILKADNIEERWKLTEFFSTVTPTDRLREKWISYKNIIAPDYNTFKKLKEKEYTLREEINAGKKSPETLMKLNQVRKQLESYETKLAEPINQRILPAEQINQKIPPTDEFEGKLKSFKENMEKEVPASTQLNLEKIFTNTTNTSLEVVTKLAQELGGQYQSLQGLPIINYKDATYTIDPGINSKSDYSKTIWPKLGVKVLPNEIIFKLTEKGIMDSLKFSGSIVNWEKMAAFERNYFLKRLEQLK